MNKVGVGGVLAKGVPGRNPLLRNESQVKAGLAIRPMGSGASELLGWGPDLTGPGEKEAQRLQGRLMDPS